MPFGTKANLGPGDVVLDGVAAPPRKVTVFQFSVYVYCGQRAGWMKTLLGTEVDLGPGYIVLDGVPAPRERGTADPRFFRPCPLWRRSPISATAELLLCMMWMLTWFHKIRFMFSAVTGGNPWPAITEESYVMGLWTDGRSTMQCVMRIMRRAA